MAPGVLKEPMMASSATQHSFLRIYSIKSSLHRRTCSKICRDKHQIQELAGNSSDSAETQNTAAVRLLGIALAHRFICQLSDARPHNTSIPQRKASPMAVTSYMSHQSNVSLHVFSLKLCLNNSTVWTGQPSMISCLTRLEPRELQLWPA